MKKQIQVVAGILHNKNRYFAVQRGEAKFDYICYKWEFPGGKIEIGENREDAIIRELKEELNIEIQHPQFLISVEHQYPDFEIVMHCFLIEFPFQPLSLSEHIAQRWLTKEELWMVDWAAADIPVVEYLMMKDIV